MDVPLKIAICEDLPQDMENMISMIKSLSLPVEITSFTSGEDFLAAYPGGKFDLVFFDIYLTGMTGTKAAAYLRSIDEHCGIVFITVSEEHMLEAFDVGAQHYLVKPIDSNKLEKVIQKRMEVIQWLRQVFSISLKGEKKDIPFNEIYYIEVQNHNCYIHTKEEVIDAGTTMTIESFIALLPTPPFVRCHKSYIVNLSYVKSIGRDFEMVNGDKVYIRRNDVRKYTIELAQWRLAEVRKELL
ncbi:MAG: response regulator transcription factor [Clostridiales bacterium]|nr:response regulator transcription factor [Clostridiales bacterium]